jgi:hemolysin type calcium-binding protein
MGKKRAVTAFISSAIAVITFSVVGPTVPAVAGNPCTTTPLGEYFGDSTNNDCQGSNGADAAYMYQGDDTFSGLQGGDYVEGNQGNDELHGNAGDDHLVGGDDNDDLWDGPGADTVDGGAGNDTWHKCSGDGETETVISIEHTVTVSC